MTDEKIIEYVMDSPENTNPSVLDSMLKSNKVQPDWNQNDSAASDYIKNRPFYEEVTEVVMLSETSFEVSESAPQVVLSESFPYTFEIGKYYTVTVDGVTETYTAVDLNGPIGIASSEEVFNGNGWACAVVENNLVFLSFDESFYGAHAISISKGANIVHKIDSKYIDESSIALSIAPSIVSSIDLSSKMDKTNPVGEGSFSLNRKGGSTIGEFSSAEGYETTASAKASHAEGYKTTASGYYGSHAEGNGTTASSNESHAEGYKTTASGSDSHAEGYITTASATGSHAEGFETTASGDKSHAEGDGTTASGNASHAEGIGTNTSGLYSHAEGWSTIAASECQHVQGKFNIEDSNDVYAHIIGGGSSGTDRKNIHTVDWSGNAWYEGTVEGKALILTSSTTGSTKRFKVTVDDTGTLTATEVTS